METPSPIAVKPQSDYRIWIKYSDGVEGEVDYSHLVGKGVFQVWNDYNYFQRVYISKAGAIAWSDEIEVCPDAAYMRLAGKSAEVSVPSIHPALSDV